MSRRESNTLDANRPRLIALVLALFTLLLYLPATHHGFSQFDDTDYVTQNPVVQNGLTWAGVRWAFATWHVSNYHPLTWLSHMLDCQLFGLNPAAHHFVNILLHAANAALLFVLIWRSTRALWPAAFVAALFAWHPLRVESVAWIAERKDVLSTLFALLTLIAYVKAVTDEKEQGKGTVLYRLPSYWLALLYFVLGLLAKPMLVTLPCVMLLLDYWPLQRLTNGQPLLKNAGRLLIEKIPFFLLTTVACVVTFLAQQHGGMVVPLDQMSVDYRLENVPLGYLRYLDKIFWPTNLSILYPLPKTFSPLVVASAIVALLLISAAAWQLRKHRPYGLTGWLWFVGTLVPVIGLVQVGRVAMSDRYSYLPSVGIFIVVAFAAQDWIRRVQWRPVIPAVGAGFMLGSCVLLTERQLSYWRDDVALFSHAVAATKNNEPAYVCLGLSLEAEGQREAALKEYRIGLKLNPNRIKTYNYIAGALAGLGRTNAAIDTLWDGLKVDPKDALTHSRLARLLADSGNTVEAMTEFQTALNINPNDTKTLNALGIFQVKLGDFAKGMNCFAQAAEIAPASWRPPYLMGLALLKQDRDAEAMPYFEQALQKNPNNLQLLLYVAQILASDENPKVRNGQAALGLVSNARSLAGDDDPAILDALAMAYAELGRFTDAQHAVQDALQASKTSGQTNDITGLRQRLQLYRNQQPYRQSFASIPIFETAKPWRSLNQ